MAPDPWRSAIGGDIISRMQATTTSAPRHDVVAAALGTWAVLGLMLDGRAHETGAVESFFTPWHGVLYSGVAAAFAAIAVMAVRRRRTGEGAWRSVLPRAYRPAAAGVALMGVAGVADMLWHAVFGIEEDLAALLSPTHLLLLSGGLLLLSAPLRAAWLDPHRGSSWRALGPAIIAATLLVTTVAFFVEFASPWHDAGPFTGGGEHGGPELGAAGMLLDTALLVGGLCVLLARFGTLPAGAATLLLTGTATLLSLAADFAVPGAIVAAALAGVLADVGLRQVVRSGRAEGVKAVLAFLPVPLWLGFFATIELSSGLRWEPELWAGSTFLAALTGYGLAALAFASPRPVATGR